MFVEDGFNRGQGLGLSFHGFFDQKLTLPAREIEAEDQDRPARDGILSNTAPPQTDQLRRVIPGASPSWPV